jgi:energy-coupling factor transport system permease protein
LSVFEGFRFRHVSSPIHDRDPRIKFVFVLVMFAVTLLFTELLPLLVLFFLPLPFVAIAGVGKQWSRSLRGAAFLATFIFVFNFGFGYLYHQYANTNLLLEYSLAMTLRFLVLVESFSVFFLTTSPDHLSLALEQSHVPYEFTFAFTTAVRFVPVLAEEAQTIMDAQKARGLELERGNFLKRVRNYIPILIPLIVSAIRRSLELAEAMESRAWGSSPKRTNLYVLKVKKGDIALLLLSAGLLALGIYARYFVAIPHFSTYLPPLPF